MRHPVTTSSRRRTVRGPADVSLLASRDVNPKCGVVRQTTWRAAPGNGPVFDPAFPHTSRSFPCATSKPCRTNAAGSRCGYEPRQPATKNAPHPEGHEALNLLAQM